MASARCCCSDHRFQFSSRGLVVERRAGCGLRRRDGLEAFGKNAAHRDCGDKNRRARLPRDRSRSGDLYFAHRRPQNSWPKTGGRSHGFRWSRPPARCNMGLHVAQTVHGRLGRTIMELGGNNALIVASERRPRNGDAIDLLRRSRHCRPTLHFHASRDHARIGCRQSAQQTFGRVQISARSAIRSTERR